MWLNVNCLCAICIDWNQWTFFAQMTSFVVRYDVIYHFFPINSQYLIMWGLTALSSPAINGTQLHKLPSPPPKKKKMRRTPSYFLNEYTLGLDKLSKLHLIPNLACEKALQLFVMRPEESCKRMFSSAQDSSRRASNNTNNWLKVI